MSNNIIRYIETLTHTNYVFYIEDLKRDNIISSDSCGDYYISSQGIFLGCILPIPDSRNILRTRPVKIEDTTQFFSAYDKQYNHNINKSLAIFIKCELEKSQIYIESKYDKKFNDLFENTSDIIKELKQDLNNKHEKIRELELKVHYIESQIEKKVTINYEEIKKRNKNLNTEFKRVAKLMKLC